MKLVSGGSYFFYKSVFYTNMHGKALRDFVISKKCNYNQLTNSEGLLHDPPIKKIIILTGIFEFTSFINFRILLELYFIVG